jgi:hypothetical protein
MLCARKVASRSTGGHKHLWATVCCHLRHRHTEADALQDGIVHNPGQANKRRSYTSCPHHVLGHPSSRRPDRHRYTADTSCRAARAAHSLQTLPHRKTGISASETATGTAHNAATAASLTCQATMALPAVTAQQPSTGQGQLIGSHLSGLLDEAQLDRDAKTMLPPVASCDTQPSLQSLSTAYEPFLNS